MYRNGPSVEAKSDGPSLPVQTAPLENDSSSQSDEALLLRNLVLQVECLTKISLPSALESYQWCIQYIHWRMKQTRYLETEAVAALLTLTLPLGAMLLKEQGAREVQLHYRTALSLAESYRLHLISAQLSEALFQLPSLLLEIPVLENDSNEFLDRQALVYQLCLLTNALYHYEQAQQTEDCVRVTQQLHQLLALASYSTLEPLLYLQFDEIEQNQDPELFTVQFAECLQRLALLGERLAQSDHAAYARALYSRLLALLARNPKLSLAIDGVDLLRAVMQTNAYELGDKKVDQLFWQPWRVKLERDREGFCEGFAKLTNALDIFPLQKKFTQQCQKLLQRILKDVEAILGPAPCDYVVLIGGSMSRGGMTLYSDIEPMLLFKFKNARNIAYFNAFIRLFSYYLYSLGESDADRPGLHLDAPNLVNEKYQPLLNTPEDFIAEWYPQGFGEPGNEALLSDGSRFSPLSAVLLYGNAGGEALFQHFQDLLNVRLEQPARADSTQTTAQYIAMTCLRHDEEEYQGLLSQLFSDPVDLKSRFAKPLTALCARLALYHGIEVRHPQDILTQLKTKIGFDAEAADRLLWALAVIEGQRLVVQKKVACQKETILLDEKAQTTVIDWTKLDEVTFDLCLPALERDIIRPLYDALQPWLYPERQRDSQRQQAQWQQTLERMTQPTKPNGLVMELAWPEIIVSEGEEEKPQVRLHQRYLRPEVAQQLVDSSGQLRTDKLLYPTANHPVYRVVWGSDDIHVKRYPESPGLELASSAFSEQFFGHSAPPVSVAKLIYQGKSEPLLLSQTALGHNLCDVQKYPKRLEQVDAMSFSEQFLLTLCENNEDDKPDRRILQPVFTRAGYYRYQIATVDKDHAFQEPLVTSWGKTQLQVKSVIYCFEQMKQPINRLAAEHFASLDSFQRLKNWLHILITLDTAIYSLFEIPALKTWMKRKALEKSTVPIFLDSVIIKEMYEKCCRIQRHLQQALANNEDLPTHSELLSLIEPQLSLYYNPALSYHYNVWQRFDALTKHAYPRNVEGHHLSLIDSPRSKRSGLRVVPNEKDLFERRLYSPARCLELLEMGLQERYQRLETCRLQLAQGNSRLFEQENFPYFRELIINGLRFKHLSEEIQITILQTLGKTPTSFRILSLHGCTALTDKLLLPLLKNSPNLWELDVSRCTKLTAAIFTNLASYNKQLERLNVSATTISNIGSNGFWEVSVTLPQLRILITRDCKQLAKISLVALQLVRWVARGCIQLREELVRIDSELSCLADLEGCTSVVDKDELILQLLYRLNAVKEFENYVEKKLLDFFNARKMKESKVIAKETANILTTRYLDPIKRIIHPKDIQKFADCAIQRIKYAIKNKEIKMRVDYFYREVTEKDGPLYYAQRLAMSVRTGSIRHNFLIFDLPIATQNEGNNKARPPSTENSNFSSTITVENIFADSIPIVVDDKGGTRYFKHATPYYFYFGKNDEADHGFFMHNDSSIDDYLYKPAGERAYAAIKSSRDHQEAIAIIAVRIMAKYENRKGEKPSKVEMANALLTPGIRNRKKIYNKVSFFKREKEERKKLKANEAELKLEKLKKTEEENTRHEENLKFLEENLKRKRTEFIQKIKAKLEKNNFIIRRFEKKFTLFEETHKAWVEEKHEEGFKRKSKKMGQSSKAEHEERRKKLEEILKDAEAENARWQEWVEETHKQENLYKAMDNNNRGAAIQRRWGAIEEADVRIKNFIERYLALCDEELEKLRQENVKLKQGLSEEKQGLSETKQRNEGKRKSIFLLQQENNDLEEEITDTEERLIASKKKLSASKESLIASRKKILESKGKIIASKNELLANKEMLIQKLEQVEARMSLISSYFKANAENPCTENDEKEKEQVQETSENISLMWQEYQKLTEESNNIKNFLKHIDFDIAKANSRIEKIDLALAELGEEEPKPEEDKAKLEEESTGLEEEQPELDQSQAADNDVTERSQSPRLN
jgi:hypothetical protein